MMSVFCPICTADHEGEQIDWADGECPHSIDDIVETLYLDINGLTKLYDEKCEDVDTLRIEINEIQHGFELQQQSYIDILAKLELAKEIINTIDELNSELGNDELTKIIDDGWQKLGA